MKKAKAVVVVRETKQVAPLTPNEMILAAVNGKANLDKVKQLMELQERYEANEAKKAYYRAMAEFKANAPHIEKNKKVSFDTTKGTTSYKHATLANIVDKITPELSKYGLSASWRTKQNGKIVVACRITHVLGYNEEIELAADADTSGSKNPIQAIGSAVTYLQRYTLLAVLGLAAEDQDDDAIGAVAAPETIDEKQISQLTDMVNDLKGDSVANMKQFKATMKIAELSEILKPNFQKAVSLLVARKKAIG